MKYVGLQAQIRRNNQKSFGLLLAFPLLLLALTWAFCFILFYYTQSQYEAPQQEAYLPHTNNMFLEMAPWVIGGVVIWFLIAYFANTQMIAAATSAHSLSRKENMRIYNLVENLCMANGMSMPKINVIEDDSLNAYASGINKKTYTVTLSRGIINRLNDEELEAVIAHELSHIKNRDVRLLIVSIIFVGIFAYLSQIAIRALFYAPRRSNNKNNGGAVVLIVVVLVLALIGSFIARLLRFGISRQREYLADAGAANMTKRPWALASALRKISSDPYIESVTRNDVAQLFIEHPKVKQKGFSLSGMFQTHPPIEKRIQILEQL